MNFDKIQADRTSEIAKKLWESGKGSPKSIFADKAIRTLIDRPKFLIPSFNINKIKALSPYSKNIIVTICPLCVKESEISSYEKLAAAGLIVPALIAPYSRYPAEVVKITSKQHHISAAEFHNFRSLAVYRSAEQALCEHCTKKHFAKTKKTARRVGLETDFLGLIKDIYGYSSPHIYPDALLLDELAVAVKNNDIATILALRDIAHILNLTRTAEALNASLAADPAELLLIPSLLPKNIEDSLDAARDGISDIRSQAAEGMGLTIPTDIPIELFIEITKDMQGPISDLVAEVTSGENQRTKAALQIQAKIANMNAEMNRLSNLKRFSALEVCSAFVRDGRVLTGAALATAAWGFGGALLGCAAGGAGAMTAQLAKKFPLLSTIKWFENARESKRLKELVQRDVQPAIDQLVAKYVGTQRPVIRMMSIQRMIKRRISASKK